MKLALTGLAIFLLTGIVSDNKLNRSSCEVMILGIAQDAGFPQIQCGKPCCKMAWAKPANRRMVASIALIDHSKKVYYVIDATPDFKEQLHYLEERYAYTLAGVLLTHAHIGHYTGLMHLGREAMGSEAIPVYAMPRMKGFLETNGPWSQLVKLNNIELKGLEHNKSVTLTENIVIRPYLVPHRDEYSETVGFQIVGPNNSGWYIPDIDKWKQWDRTIHSILDEDFALVDGTFYRNGEIPGRDMSEIPHPFIEETMKLLSSASKEKKSRLHFIHFNHTNPVLTDESVRAHILDEGFQICNEGDIIKLD